MLQSHICLDGYDAHQFAQKTQTPTKWFWSFKAFTEDHKGYNEHRDEVPL